ncbi:MAG TPA: superoxide dismutase [Patescibacteria group bacterium]|nr:superoxide dismutase [Patescibacteria group bacterium]
MKYELPKLNYSYDALEPVIDAKTMEIHHSKHHQAYVDNANKIMDKYPQLADKKLEEILTDIDSYGLETADRQGLINQGGGVINHNLHWQMIDPNNTRDENLAAAIEKEFGSVEEFKKIFGEAGLKQFGSGWAWLVKDKTGKLLVYALPNQETPYAKGHTPILTMDVWEHAYYLKYQNRRAEYIDNWWKAVRILG